MPRSPKGRAAARGLDARLRLQHAFMPAGDASLKTAQLIKMLVDSNHGIYRVPGHYNPDPSEGPWGRRSTPPHGGAQSSPQARLRAVPSMWATKCTKDGRKLDDDQRMPGAGLS